MFKKFASFLVIVSLIMSYMPVVSAEVLGSVRSIADPIADCNEFTPPANIFRIEGDSTDFILVNTTFDNGSKFYVMMKDDVGSMAYDPDGTQRFDVSDPNNIAYWLNNEFLKDGGINGRKIPDEVIKYINPESKFDTEAGHPSGNASEGYTVTAKIALMSQTEYSNFYRNFGIRDNMSGAAWWLRTAFARSNEDTMLVPKISDDIVNGRTIQWSSKTKLLVRPVFYLNSDFFKNVKVQVPTLGSNVKKAILANYTTADLEKAGYTAKEIEMISDTSADVSEKFTVSFDKKESVGKLMTPEAAEFTVKGIVSGKAEKEYSIYFKCPELGIPNTVSKVMMKPGVEFSKTFKLKDIQNGVGKLVITVKDEGRVSFTAEEDLYIMPRYQPLFMENFSQHGVGTHYPQAGQSNSNDTELLKRAGIRQVRDSIGWASLEQTDGTWSTAKTDVYIPAVTSEAGIDWTAIVYGTHENYTTVAPSSPSDITGFSNYAKRLADFYPQIDRFEIWNEPNLSSWRPKPNALEYQKVTKAVGKSLLEVNPNAHIIAGSINSFDNTYTKNMMKDGLYPYMTHFSYHPYITPAEVDDQYEAKWERILETTLSYGGWKDIYVTEVGWPTHESPTGNTEYAQAVEVPKMYMVADAMNHKNNAYYTFRDPGNDRRENEHMFGLIRRNLEPKLSYLTTTQLNMALGGGVYMGQMFMEGDLTAHVYMKDHQPTIAIWTTKGKTVTEYDFGEEVTAVDMCGNKLQPVSGNKYAIGREPVYVTGAGKQWFNRAVGQFNSKKIDELIKKYSKGIPQEIINGLNLSRDYLRELESKNTLPSESEISEKMSFHYKQGTELLNAHKNGSLSMSDTEVSIALFLMHRAGVGYGNLLAAASVANGEITSTARVAQMRNKIKDRSKTYYDGSLQYTEAIAYYAAQHNIDAEEVKAINTNNPSKSGIIKAYDRLANEILDWADIWVGFEPVISTAFLIEIPVADTSVFTGEKRDINVGIRSFSDSLQKGKIQLFDPSGVKFAESDEITIDPKAVTEVNVQAMFTFDFQNIPQEFTVKVENAQGDIIASSLVTFTVRDKVEIGYDVQNGTVDAVKELKLNLKNIYTDPVSGTVKLTPPEGWSLANDTADFSLDVNGTQTVTFKVTGTSARPFNIYTVNTLLTDNSGLKVVEANYALTFTPIVKNSGKISLAEFKGDMSDWADAYPAFINQPKDANSLQEWRKADISGMVFLKWDEDNLYMLYNIYDEKYIQHQTGNGMWSGDSIQFALDCGNTKSTSYDTDDYEIGFSYTTKGQEVFCWTAPNPDDGGEWTDDIVMMYRDDDLKITRSLVVLPKDRVAPLELVKGRKIGFNAALNDADFDKRETYVQITNGLANGKNPSLYHSYEMIDPQSPQPVDMIEKYSLPVDLTVDYQNNFASFGHMFLVNTDDDEASAMFSDVTDHWARADIENMAKRSIVNGVGDKIFEPDRNITRAEFTALLAKAGLEAKAYGGGLSDVSSGVWYSDFIQSALDAGIIPGEMYSDGSFYPDSPITRGEMAVMTVKMYGYKTGMTLEGKSGVFTDEQAFLPWAGSYIYAAYEAGLIKGMPDGSYSPETGATRAESAVILKRLLSKI